MARAKYDDNARQIDYKEVFGTATGRKVLTDIMVKASVFTPIMGETEFDRGRMEGMRQLALHISSFVRFNADKFMEHWKEPDEA